MSDYRTGVLDVLCWVKKLILGYVDPELEPLEILDRVIKTVEKMIRDVQEGGPIPDIEPRASTLLYQVDNSDRKDAKKKQEKKYEPRST